MSARQWVAALLELETNPDLDPDERHRLANVVRDEVEEVERTIGASATRGAEVARKVLEPPGPRERVVRVWQRGSSLSVSVMGPEDASWIEELATDPPFAMRLRLEIASEARVVKDRDQAWRAGLRAHALPVRARLPGLEGANIALREAAIDGGDWLVTGMRRRNVGGHSARALVVTFGFLKIDRVGKEGEEEVDE